MLLRDLFVIRHPPALTEGPEPAGASASVETPVFITLQAFLSFPGASLTIMVFWKGLGLFSPALGTDKRVAVVLALVVGLVIAFINLKPEMSTRDKAIAMILGVANSFYLALFVTGGAGAIMGGTTDAAGTSGASHAS